TAALPTETGRRPRPAVLRPAPPPAAGPDRPMAHPAIARRRAPTPWRTHRPSPAPGPPPGRPRPAAPAGRRRPPPAPAQRPRRAGVRPALAKPTAAPARPEQTPTQWPRSPE